MSWNSKEETEATCAVQKWKFNLCLKMALSTNSTDTDFCEAVLGKSNVMGQTSQLTEDNCLT
jgi:hypothetical protein